MTENKYSDYAVHAMSGVRRTRVCNPEVLGLRTTALPRPKAFGVYRKNQSTNHIEADSCEGKSFLNTVSSSSSTCTYIW